MNGMLAAKQVLITGATRGIGAAIATTFAAQGAHLYLNGRHLPQLEALAQELINDYGVEVECLAFDVSDATQVKQGFQALFKLTKRLDVLVNNAGILDDALLAMVSSSQVQQTFATNSFSVIYCSQYASRLMARHGGGSIINLASIIGRVGNAGQSVYGGSKAAVIGITQSLAKELAAQQIRVNAIAPGFIDTPMTANLPADKYQQRLDSIAMGRIGSAQDVANVALFLASDLSQYVTGQTLGVDGGMLI
ncbi:SDR family NAD(P)-dependent oxidoreductase [Shewanella sp. NIFS-20-20]|uniref:SDR family NAD(P)-dependent oxidoreductase n=1 Tax=Shewanella sp. NIFS-20-20 TaxID=2853806 RepID=UPI00210A8A29|nr:SDR family NAD(P)-dependent oxidoreductase [Shewanella sp. NIFS-20-20]